MILGGSSGAPWREAAVNRLNAPILRQADQIIHDRMQPRSALPCMRNGIVRKISEGRFEAQRREVSGSARRCLPGKTFFAPRARARLSILIYAWPWGSPPREKECCPAKKIKKVVDRKKRPAYTNVTGDAHRGAPMTVL